MKGILINYEYCTGCHSCEVACRNELGLQKGEFGIKLTEIGPYEYKTPISSDTPYEWVYNPTITKACNMCKSRVEEGKMPSCVQACQAWCMYYGDAEDLVRKMDGRTRWALYTAIDSDNEFSTSTEFEPMYDKSTLRAAAFAEISESEQTIHAEPINVDENTLVSLTIENEEKFDAFVTDYATIDIDKAKELLQDQFLENPARNSFVLDAEISKDGSEKTLSYQGVPMLYDAQGTQLGGGKAYLDKGQPVARVDITVVF